MGYTHYWYQGLFFPTTNQVVHLVPHWHYLGLGKVHLLLYVVSSPGVVPLTCVLGRLAPPHTPRDTYLAELTPVTGLSHWWALPHVLQRTPSLGGDRLGFS